MNYFLYFRVIIALKVAALMYLVRSIIPPNQLTIIFTATKHHSEFLYLLFEVFFSNFLIFFILIFFYLSFLILSYWNLIESWIKEYNCLWINGSRCKKCKFNVSFNNSSIEIIFLEFYIFLRLFRNGEVNFLIVTVSYLLLLFFLFVFFIAVVVISVLNSTFTLIIIFVRMLLLVV